MDCHTFINVSSIYRVKSCKDRCTFMAISSCNVAFDDVMWKNRYAECRNFCVENWNERKHVSPCGGNTCHRDEIPRVKARDPGLDHREAFKLAAKNVRSWHCGVSYSLHHSSRSMMLVAYFPRKASTHVVDQVLNCLLAIITSCSSHYLRLRFLQWANSSQNVRSGESAGAKFMFDNNLFRGGNLSVSTKHAMLRSGDKNTWHTYGSTLPFITEVVNQQCNIGILIAGYGRQTKTCRVAIAGMPPPLPFIFVIHAFPKSPRFRFFFLHNWCHALACSARRECFHH